MTRAEPGRRARTVPGRAAGSWFGLTRAVPGRRARTVPGRAVDSARVALTRAASHTVTVSLLCPAGLGLCQGSGRRTRPDSRGAGPADSARRDSRGARPADSDCEGAGGGLGLTRAEPGRWTRTAPGRAGGLGFRLFRGEQRTRPDSRGARPTDSDCAGAGGGLGLTRGGARPAE
jgi:hypothetical protein